MMNKIWNYLVLLYRQFIFWVMSTRLYSWVLLDVLPYIRFTTYYTTFRGWKYFRGYKLLQPGDIMVAVDRKKLTHFLIPGTFCHAIQCVDKGSEYECAEMTAHNFTHSTFFDICKEADRVVILRCRDYDPAYIQTVIAACNSHQDDTYNIDFEFGIPALYCSELVYLSDVEHRLQVSLGDLADLGRPYISPDALYEAKNVDIIWDSDQEIPDPALAEFNG